MNSVFFDALKLYLYGLLFIYSLKLVLIFSFIIYFKICYISHDVYYNLGVIGCDLVYRMAILELG